MRDADYSLVWSEEFNYEGRVNDKDWSYDIGHGTNGWGNKEAQYYSDVVDNCRVRDGRLEITGRNSEIVNRQYTSAKIHTAGKLSWQYGRFEVRAKLPTGAGTWPAIWMLSDAEKSGTKWPLCGEIDIIEHIGRNPATIHFSLHSQRHNHTMENQVIGVHHLPCILDGFHTYRMDWEESGFVFSVDDEVLSSFPRGDKSGEEEWPFDQPFYLIINLALGGYWGGEIDDSALPASFEIDYVKVFQRRS